MKSKVLSDDSCRLVTVSVGVLFSLLLVSCATANIISCNVDNPCPPTNYTCSQNYVCICTDGYVFDTAMATCRLPVYAQNCSLRVGCEEGFDCTVSLCLCDRYSSYDFTLNVCVTGNVSDINTTSSNATNSPPTSDIRDTTPFVEFIGNTTPPDIRDTTDNTSSYVTANTSSQNDSTYSYIPVNAASTYVPDNATPTYVPDDTTSTYVTDNTTSTYVTDNATSTYVTDNTTSTYVTDNTTSTYVTDNTTPTYVTDNTTSTYVTDNTTSTYVTDNTTSTYVTDNTTSTYVTDNTTSTYVTDNTTSTYVTDNTTSTYVTDNATSTYVTDNTTSTYVTDNTTSTYVTDNTTSTYVTDNTTPTYVTDNTTSTYVTDNTTSTYVTDNTTPSYVPDNATSTYVPDNATPTYVPDDTTSTYVTDNATSTYVTDNATSTYVSDNATSTYVPDDTTPTDDADNTTSMNVMDNTTATSVMDNITSTYAADNTTSRIVPESTTSTNVPDNTTSTDAIANMVSTNVMNNTTFTNVMDNTTSSSFTGRTKGSTSVDSTPDSESSTTDYFTTRVALTSPSPVSTPIPDAVVSHNATLIEPSSGPIIESMPVVMKCVFDLVHRKPEGFIVWYLNEERIRTGESLLFKEDNSFSAVSGEDLNIPSSVHVNVYRYQSTLHVDGFDRNFAGNYTCKLEGFQFQPEPPVGRIRIREDELLLRPNAVLYPLSLSVQPNSQVTLHCDVTSGTVISFVEITNEQESDLVLATLSSNFTFIVTSPIRVRCIVLHSALLDFRLRSNIVNIFLIEGEACEATTDGQGTKWPVASAGVITKSECPVGHSGYATRKCSSNGDWEEPNYAKCVKEVLEEIMEQVAIYTSDIEISSETINKMSSLMYASLTDVSTILSGDVAQVADILSSLAHLMGGDIGLDDVEELLTPEALELLISVANQILLVDTSVWQQLDKIVDDDAQSGDVETLAETGAKLLAAVDDLVTFSLNGVDFPTVPIVRENIVIKRETLLSPEDIVFPKPEAQVDGNDYNDMIQNPPVRAFMSSSAYPAGTQSMGYSIVLFRGVENKFKPRYSSTDGEGLTGKEIRSDILSFSLSLDIPRIEPGLSLTFAFPTDNFTDPVCAFLNTSFEPPGVWSTAGCVTFRDESGVRCSCSHLTNFAVLMSPSGTNMEQHEALSIITQVGCGISIFFLTTTIFIYAVLWEYVEKDDRSILHLHLSGCLLVAFIIFLAGIEQTGNDVACTVIASLLHFLFLAVFFLMLFEGLEVFMGIVVIFKKNPHLKKLIVAAYVFPLVIVGSCLAITQAKDYRSDDFCWLSVDSNLLWAFAGPALLIILVNLIIMGIAMHTVVRATSQRFKSKAEEAKSAARSLCILSPIFGVTWLFGILSVNDNTVAFQYLFAIFNSLQGLGIFIVYCVHSKKVREGFRMRMKKRKARSFLTGQKTSSAQSSRKSESCDINSNSENIRKVTSPSSALHRSGTMLQGKAHDFSQGFRQPPARQREDSGVDGCEPDYDDCSIHSFGGSYPFQGFCLAANTSGPPFSRSNPLAFENSIDEIILRTDFIPESLFDFSPNEYYKA